MKIFIEVLGWYGMVSILLAYAFLSFEVVDSTSLMYQLLNATGAFGIILVSLKKRAYQPGVLNIIWLLIAVVAILRIGLTN
jgi:hypothetical protein